MRKENKMVPVKIWDYQKDYLDALAKELDTGFPLTYADLVGYLITYHKTSRGVSDEAEKSIRL
jgi:hypothetical protein